MTLRESDTEAIDWLYGIPAHEWEDIIFEDRYGDTIREQTDRECAEQNVPLHVTVQL